jgi:hypothetical protein
VDLPPNREQEFRAAIESIGGERLASTNPATTAEPGSSAFAEATADKPPPAKAEKKSFVVQIVEKSAEMQK